MKSRSENLHTNKVRLILFDGQKKGTIVKRKRIIKARVQYFNTSSHASIDSVHVWGGFLVEKLNWTKLCFFWGMKIFILTLKFFSKIRLKTLFKKNELDRESFIEFYFPLKAFNLNREQKQVIIKLKSKY